MMENDPNILPNQRRIWPLILSSILLSSFFGAVFGFMAGGVMSFIPSQAIKKIWPGNEEVIDERQIQIEREKIVQEDTIITDMVEKSSPAVVSIVITKDVSRFRSFNDPFEFFIDPFQQRNQQIPETERQRVGSGTGFFVSENGMIVTNKHVVSDTDAQYTVITTDGKEYEAKVLALDPVQDIAIIQAVGNGFATLDLGDAEELKIGQTVIAIGNSLGEFSNTVSKGIISGLKRDLVAGSGFGQAERLSDIIQTDAAINPGNSGGPLLDINGKVIGVNVAIAQGAENVGFAIPVNRVKRVVDQVKETGKISTPFLGVRYFLIDSELKGQNNLPFDYGVLVQRGERMTDLAVIPGSPADKAGIVENDIILEINGKKINTDNQLADLISDYNVGEEIMLKVWHRGETKEVKVKLEEKQ